MSKKIDNSVKQHIKELCYSKVFAEPIDKTTRSLVKYITETYLNNNGYKINWVKCNEENNPPNIIDAGKLVITISEEDFPGSQSEKIHTIVL